MLVRSITAKREEKLKEKFKSSDLLLKKLSQQIPGVIYQYQYFPDGRNCFPFASEYIWDIYEVTPEEVKESAAKVLSRLHPEDYDSVVAKIVYSFESLEIWEDEYRVILPQKGLRWLHGIARPEKQNDESVIWYGYIYDITKKKENEEKVIKLKEQFELAIKGTNDGIWDWDLQTNIVFLSKKWKEILGYEDFELKNEFETFKSLIYEEDWENVNTYINSYLNGEIENYSMEFRMKKKDGSLCWILAKGEALRNKDGIPYRMAGSHSDITEKKQAEIALKESEEQFRQLTEIFPEVIFEADLFGNLTYANEYSFKKFGFDKNVNINTLNIFSLVCEKDLSRVIQRVKERLIGNIGGFLEYKAKKSDGTFFDALAYSIPIFKKEKIIGIRGFILDVTERKKIETKLKENEEYQRLLIENLSIGIIIIDPKTRIIETVNTFAAKMIGSSVNDIIGKKCHSFICPNMENKCPICDENQIIDNSDRILLKADGTKIPVLKTVKRIKINGEEKLLESFIDITEKNNLKSF